MRGVAMFAIQLGEGVQHSGVRRNRAENPAGVGGPARQGIQLRDDERDVGILGIEAPSSVELRLRLAVAPGAQIGEAEVGVAQRVARRERDDRTKLLLGLG